MLFGHQGGWDEILFVLAPIALFGLLLSMANRRAVREQEARRSSDDAGGGPPPGGVTHPGDGATPGD